MFFAIMVCLMFFNQTINSLATSFLQDKTALIGLVARYPLVGIMVSSLILALFSTLFYKFGVDKETLASMKEHKEKTRELQKQMKDHHGDQTKLAELQKEMMEISMASMKLPMKMMMDVKFILFTTLPFILLLWFFVAPLYTLAKVGNIIYWRVNLPIFGDGAGWLLSSIIFLMVFSSILRKLLKVEM